MRMRDELGAVYDDQMFASAYPARGQPALHGVADNLGRKPVAGVAGAGRCRHPTRLPGSAPSHKPASSQVDGADEMEQLRVPIYSMGRDNTIDV